MAPDARPMEQLAFVHAADDGLSVVFLNMRVTTEQVRGLISRLSHHGFDPDSVRWWFADVPEDFRELKDPVLSLIHIPQFRIYTIVEVWSYKQTTDLHDIMLQLHNVPGLHWQGYTNIARHWGCTFGAVRYGPHERPRMR